MKISVSNLDFFRKWRLDEELPLGVLLQRFSGVEAPSEAMQVGTALHSILEEDLGDLYEVECGGFLFRFKLDAELALPAIREMRMQKTYDFRTAGAILGGSANDDRDAVTLRGRVDGLDGLTVTDHKSTSYFDPLRFTDSMQWKCYLSMLEADRFVYNIFEIKIEGPLAWMDGSGNDATGSHMVTEVTVKDIHQMTFYRYPGMEEDIRDEVARFRDFVLSNPALTLA